MLHPRRLVLLGIAVVLLAACERTPVDPLDPRADVAASLAASAGAPPLSLPALLHAAIRRVHAEQGSDAARLLVADLHDLQRVAGNGLYEVEEARRRAVRAEEIGIVLRVLGEDVVRTVMAGVGADTDRLAAMAAVLDAEGRDLPRSREQIDRVRGLLALAAARAHGGDAHGALDAATSAAAIADALRHAALDAARLPTLERLFEQAAERLRADEVGDVGPVLARYATLQDAAGLAVRSGNRDRAHASLRAARDEQITIVLDVLGDPAVASVIRAVDAALAEAGPALRSARVAGRDVFRLERMADAARDLNYRAAHARAAGDLRLALDLASHAANLVNALRIALATG